MIRITVKSLNGVPPTERLSAVFGELGGTIGRAETNQLVLQDLERTVSRVHAQIVQRGTGFVILDRGSNPILLNDQPLGSGCEAALQAGDELRIGGYCLSVELAAERPPKPPAPSPLGAGDPFGMPTRPAAPLPLGGGLPPDWDPFAPAAPEPQVAPAPRPPFGIAQQEMAPAPLGIEPGQLKRPGQASLDTLFDLEPASGGDPLAGSPLVSLAGASRGGNGAGLGGFLERPPVAPAPLPDSASDWNLPFQARRTAQPAPQPIPGAVMSWHEGEGASGLTLMKPVARASATPDERMAPSPRAQPRPAADSRRARQPADEDLLLQALLEGLGMPGLGVQSLTPGLMKLVGQLLRESTQGTVELLAARAALKRELHANQTSIVARENNPLKFSPTVEVALNHLLQPATVGFLAAVPAMRDAYDDLRAHQFGMMAGMRAALDGVVGRFDPAVLEARLSQRQFLDSVLPAGRKARLWELFTELYDKISAEAVDDFQVLFGKAFLRAYEAHVDELQEGRQ